MECRKRNLPTVNEMGKEIEAEGLVTFGKRAYNQTSNNCFEIASNIATMFGYVPPKSRAELIDMVYARREEQLGWRQKVNRRASPAVLITRTPDNVNDMHVTFEFSGREYNYGPGVREGFEPTMRIPLYP